MWFCLPSAWNGVRGKAWHAIICNAKMRKSCATLTAFMDSNLDTHAMVGVLLHQQATCGVWARFAKFSRTNHWRMSPTISRSKFEIVPFGLSCIISCFWISGGNGTCQTIGGEKCFSNPNHTPPTPCHNASQ